MTPVSNRGFSLAETLLALAVASSAAVAVIGLLAEALNTALDCRRLTAAGLLAQRLTADSTWDSSFEILLVDQALQPLLRRRDEPGATEAAYIDGSSLPTAAHFARIDRLPAPAPAQSTAERLRICIESPASAPAGRRQVHTYVTLAPPRPGPLRHQPH